MTLNLWPFVFLRAWITRLFCKCHAGFAPRVADNAWARRLRVTAESFVVMVRFTIGSDQRKPVGARRKVDKTTLEDAAAMAAVVVNVVPEVRAATSLEVGPALAQAFQDGDATLELELGSALADKAPTWDPATQLSVVQKLVQSHVERSNDRAAAEAEMVRVQAGALAEEEWKLFHRKVEFDVQAHAVWESRCSDREASAYYQTLHHRLNRQKRAEELAGQLLDPSNPNYRAKVLVATDATRTALAVEAAVTEVRGKQRGTAASPIAVVVFVNFSTPSVFPAEFARIVYGVLGSVLNNQGGPRLGFVLTPVWVYEKRYLWKAETAFLQQLFNSSVQADRQVALVFGSRGDARDKRPPCLAKKIFLVMDQ